jgi:MraZ protein
MFFIGTYNHSLDEKNRITMPSRLRDKLGATVYITLGLDKCLAVYPEETFIQIASNLSKASSLQNDNRGYKRTFFANSYECDIDKQGRVQLSKELCEKCSVKKDVVVIGVDDHVEIWDREQYYAMSEENDQRYEENASKISYGE